MIKKGIFICVICCFIVTVRAQQLPDCDSLFYGQYTCILPNISSTTYEYEGCSSNNSVNIECSALEQVECNGSRSWTMELPCRYTNGHYFSTTLALSVFLGICGIDRFYLGYPAIGFLKLLTFGGFLVGNWVDIILISTQVLKPADGSDYVIPPNGPKVTPYRMNSNTYVVPEQPDYEL